MTNYEYIQSMDKDALAFTLMQLSVCSDVPWCSENSSNYSDNLYTRWIQWLSEESEEMPVEDAEVSIPDERIIKLLDKHIVIRGKQYLVHSVNTKNKTVKLSNGDTLSYAELLSCASDPEGIKLKSLHPVSAKVEKIKANKANYDTYKVTDLPGLVGTIVTQDGYNFICVWGYSVYTDTVILSDNQKYSLTTFRDLFYNLDGSVCGVLKQE